MITKEEYKEWNEKYVDPLGEDGEAVSNIADLKYKELTTGMVITIVEHDWKETGDHWREVCKKVIELSATNMHMFQAFHDFPNGSLDAIITVISVDEIPEEFAEVLCDLVVNLSAEGS